MMGLQKKSSGESRMKCKIYKFLYKVIPVNMLRSYLITKHFSRCNDCSAELADETTIAGILIGPGKTTGEMDLWAGIQRDIFSLQKNKQPKPGKTFARVRKWQLGLSGALILLILIIVPSLLKKSSGTDPETAGIINSEIVVKSLRIDKQPVRSYFFQSADANKIIVWVQKTKS